MFRAGSQSHTQSHPPLVWSCLNSRDSRDNQRCPQNKTLLRNHHHHHHQPRQRVCWKRRRDERAKLGISISTTGFPPSYEVEVRYLLSSAAPRSAANRREAFEAHFPYLSCTDLFIYVLPFPLRFSRCIPCLAKSKLAAEKASRPRATKCLRLVSPT